MKSYNMNLFLVWLILTQHNYLEIHPCYCKNMHHPCCSNSLFFFKTEKYSVVCIYICFIHSSISRCIIASIIYYVSNATMNAEVHVYFQISIFTFLEKIPRSGIAGSYGIFIWILEETQYCFP